MITVTKRFEFCYGHYLPDYDGKCAAQHGHNSFLEVELKGSLEGHPAHLKYPGMVMDFGDIKRVVGYVIEQVDHKNLNDALPNDYQPPTAENMARYFADEIKKHLAYERAYAELVRVRVSETSNSWAEWKND